MPIHPNPHGPAWIVRQHADDISRGKLSGVLMQLAQAVEASGTVQLTETRNIEIPDSVEFSLTYEQTPHGSYALVVRAEWVEHPDCDESTGLDSLVIRPVMR